MFKYFDLFRKCLSGSPGKNLIDLSFPLEAEREGGAQEFLMKLRASRLTDDALLDEFYDRINAEYDCEGSFLILLIHSVYDIPGKASDKHGNVRRLRRGVRISPLQHLSGQTDKAGALLQCRGGRHPEPDPGLAGGNARCGLPLPGFHGQEHRHPSSPVLFQKPRACPRPLWRSMFWDARSRWPAAEQKETFNAFVEETLGEDCDYETVKNIHERLNEILEENKEDPEPVTLDKAEIRTILAESGAGEEQLAEFESHYEETAGAHASLLASNIANTRRFEVRTPDVTIHTAPERADLIETRVIDGRPCLVIPMEGRVEVNGIAVSTALQEAEASETAGADIPQ